MDDLFLDLGDFGGIAEGNVCDGGKRRGDGGAGPGDDGVGVSGPLSEE